MGKLSRNKGAAEERRVASEYKKRGWDKVRRMLSQYQQSSGRDLENVEPFCIQVKVGESVHSPIHLTKALSEAFSAAKKKEIPIVHSRKNGEKQAVVYMMEEDWFRFVELLSNGQVEVSKVK